MVSVDTPVQLPARRAYSSERGRVCFIFKAQPIISDPRRAGSSTVPENQVLDTE
jgi:hypothetical protein